MKAIKQHPHAITEQEGECHLKDCLFNGHRSNIWNALHYMYDKPNSQYSKLVMAAGKAQTETLGSGVSEAIAKSAVVNLDKQQKANSSKIPYEAIMQQIPYLMSAITNQTKSSSRQNSVKCNNVNGKFPNTKTQGFGKICTVANVEELDMGGGNAQHLDKAIISLSNWLIEI